MRNYFAAGLSGIALFGLFSCTDQPESQPAKTVQTVPYSGYYNLISGGLSDGTPVSGVAWFQGNDTRGTACVTAGEMVCSGHFSTSRAKTITAKLRCSSGVSINVTTERVPDGDFVTPVAAQGTLSDGRQATAQFSPLANGSGSATCYR
jgi:hypothetical protein